MPHDGQYRFRAMTRADLPMLALWLATPEIVRWWGDPATELALVGEDLDNPQMDQRIVSLDGQPFGYVQHYEVHAWGAPHLADFPKGSLALDACIGVPAMLGCGHGGAFLRQHALDLVAAGAPALVVDPDPANERAVRAYRRAGFRDVAVRNGEDGDPVLVMNFDPGGVLAPSRSHRPSDV